VTATFAVPLNTNYNQLLDPNRPRCLCAEYQAIVVDRHTLQPIVRLPVYATSGTWSRELNQTSEATATVDLSSPLSGNCCRKLTQVSEWGHELIITRAGDQHACWIGPIVSAQEQNQGTQFAIRALYRTSWFTRIPVPVDVVYGDANPIDASQLFKVLYDLAKTQFDPQLTLIVTNTGINVTQTIVGTDQLLLTDAITSSATAAADWVTVGSTLLIGGKLVPAPYIKLRSSMWVDPGPSVTEDGRALATHVTVFGDKVQATYPSGPPFTPHPFYGLHLHKATDNRFTDVASCLAAAKSLYELNSQPAVFITTSDTSLGPKSTVLPPQLIPGQTALIAIEQGCRSNAQTVQARLSRMEVEWTDGVETSVKPDFQPPGSIDVVVGGYQ